MWLKTAITQNRCFTVVAALMVVMAVPDWGWAQTHRPSAVAIDSLTRVIVAANRANLPDPLKVQIGDSVRVPVKDGYAIYLAEPWMFRSNGAKGCFWDIAEGHLAEELIPAKVVLTAPPDTATVPAVIPVTEASTFSLGDALLQRYLGIPLWMILLFGIAAVGAAEYYRRKRNERQLDPAADPPVVYGGLSDDPQTTLRQVQAATIVRHGTNRNVLSVERGTLRSTNGRRSFIVPMEFGDNVTRNKRVSAGDSCWRVRVVGHNARVGTEVADHQLVQTEYWYHHCGNRFGEVKSGQFELPAGWEFVATPGAAAQVPPVVVGQPDLTAEVTEVARDIEHAAVRIDAARHAQALANPDGKYTVAITVSSNGDPHPKTTTIEATGHRPIREAKVHKDGTVTVSLSS